MALDMRLREMTFGQRDPIMSNASARDAAPAHAGQRISYLLSFVRNVFLFIPSMSAACV